MNIQERLAAELEELDGKFKPSQDTGQAEAGENEVIVSNPDVDGREAAERTEEVPQKKTRTNWKAKYNENQKRMAGLKASSDTFKHTTRMEIETLKQQIEILRTAPKVAADPFEDVFSEQDADTIGEEAVDIIKRASQKASENQVNPLKSEIAQLKAERVEADKRAAVAAQVSEYKKFTNALTKKVNNWEELNKDPGFLDFLSEVDEDSGYTRAVMIRRAEGSRDVKRVADFMVEYNKITTPEDKLEEQVGPTGTSTTSVVKEEDKGEMIAKSFVDQFYQDSIRGRYKEDPQLAIETQVKINKAIHDNMVDYTR